MPKYRVSEAWNGPNNGKLLGQGTKTYIAPEDRQSTPSSLPDNASYVAVVGPNALWQADKPVKLGDVHEQLGETILLVEVVNSGIAWTEPRDVSWADAPKLLNTSSSLISLRKRRVPGGFFFQEPPESVLVLLADGGTGYLSGAQLTPEGLKAALAVGGYVGNDTRLPGRHLNWQNCCTLMAWTGSIYLLLRRLASNFPAVIQGQRKANSRSDK